MAPSTNIPLTFTLTLILINQLTLTHFFFFNDHQIHNTSATRARMAELFDPQFANVTDYDCFSQAVFRSLEDYKRIKQDPWYKEHLIGDHENFADTKRSQYVLFFFSCFFLVFLHF